MKSSKSTSIILIISGLLLIVFGLYDFFMASVKINYLISISTGLILLFTAYLNIKKRRTQLFTLFLITGGASTVIGIYLLSQGEKFIDYLSPLLLAISLLGTLFIERKKENDIDY